MKKTVITSTIALGALALISATGAVLAINQQEDIDQSAVAATTTVINVNTASIGWSDSSLYVGIRAFTESGTAIYGGGSSGTASETSDDYKFSASVPTSHVTSFSITDLSATITGIQFYLSGTSQTVYKTCTIAAGGTYTATIGAWASAGHPLSIVDAGTTATVTVNFTTSYLLDTDYYATHISYTTDSSTYYSADFSTDGTLANSVYTYSASLPGMAYDTEISYKIYMDEKVPAVAEAAWPDVATGLTFTPVTGTVSVTNDFSTWTNIYGYYNLGLATDWAKTFLTALESGQTDFTAGVCVSNGSTDESTLSTAWTTLSGTYASLGDDVKTIFTGATATANSPSYVQAAKALYIAARKNHTALADFASIGSSAAVTNEMNDDDLSLGLALGISCLGIALAAAFFLYSKKTKLLRK